MTMSFMQLLQKKDEKGMLTRLNLFYDLESDIKYCQILITYDGITNTISTVQQEYDINSAKKENLNEQKKCSEIFGRMIVAYTGQENASKFIDELGAVNADKPFRLSVYESNTFTFKSETTYLIDKDVAGYRFKYYFDSTDSTSISSFKYTMSISTDVK